MLEKDEQQRRFTFKRAKRLLSPSDFKYVFESPRKLKFSGGILYTRMNQLTFARIGLAIPKRNIPSGLNRNRLKRLIRESFRHHPNLPAIDIVVVVDKSANQQTNAEFAERLNHLWEKLSS